MVGQWWVIMARPGHAMVLTHELRGKGINVFMPLTEKIYKVKRGFREERIRRMVPYLPCGYLAICGGVDDRYEAACSPHKWQIIDVVNQKRLVQELIIVEHAAESGFKQIPNVVVGDRVRIKDGPLMGVEGRLEETPEGKNFIVLLKMFGNTGAYYPVSPDRLEKVED
jgi:transcriptional antiterminator RfaH